ncbi:MAG: GNAT family N-acetyltransferase [Halobacteriovoraceae bacterium]|jgi:GNAT superfamily N-acetyltransferase|nr:GNAT family N-acetyltransferase [Halobacteriovoraceae bacterium]
MSDYTIKNFLDLNDTEIEKVNEIFFESSSKSHFLGTKEKEKFQYKYLDYYKVFFPQLFFVITVDSQVKGYICGISEILKDKKSFEISSHLHAFKDLYKKFPAHLHINMASDSRGMGLGSILINHFEKLLKERSIVGMHIITSPKAQNIRFYTKNHFKFSKHASYKSINYLFMGRSLT